MTFYLAALGIGGIALNGVIITGCLTLKKIDFVMRILVLITALIVLNTEPYNELFVALCLIFYLAKNLDNLSTKKSELKDVATEESKTETQEKTITETQEKCLANF